MMEALSGKTWTMNPKRESLFSFAKESDVERFEMFSDNEFGGKSTGFFNISQEKRFATFRGNLSLELPEKPINRRLVTKTGMVAIRAALPFSLPPTSEYDSFLLTARGDGSKFLVNATVMANDNKEILQAGFESPSEWSDIIIPFRVFVPAWRNSGYMPKSNRGLDLASMDLTHLGIMMSERKSGPFHLDIYQIEVFDSNKQEKRKFAFNY